VGKLVRAANLKEKFERLEVWIEENPREDFSIIALAKLARMSERSFERRYVEVMGRTPRAFVEDVRVTAACRVMAESRVAALDQIAVDVGMKTAHKLRRAFIRRLGMTADAWRELEEATRPGGRRMTPEDELKLLETVDTIDKRVLCLGVHLDRQVAFLFAELGAQLAAISKAVGIPYIDPREPASEETADSAPSDEAATAS
jgi:AraC-like DNA-binding protein